MTVVCDTNVFISALIAGGNPGKIIDLALRKQIILVTSPELLVELSAVLRDAFHWSIGDIHDAVRFFGKLCVVIRPQKRCTVIEKDPSDNRVLECADATHTDYIVSGDRKHVLPLKRFRKISILSPADFLLRVAANER